MIVANTYYHETNRYRWINEVDLGVLKRELGSFGCETTPFGNSMTADLPNLYAVFYPKRVKFTQTSKKLNPLEEKVCRFGTSVYSHGISLETLIIYGIPTLAVATLAVCILLNRMR